MLENFSYNFEGGPFCVTGESGRGKTTLFNLILGLAQPDRGTVEKEGIENFSVVFQEDRLCENLSAVMNLAIVREERDRDEILGLLGEMRLSREDCLRPVSELSGGQRRRVAIARALYRPRRRVLMDEPFKGLDRDTREAVMRKVREATADRLFIFITHEPEEAGFFGAVPLNIKIIE